MNRMIVESRVGPDGVLQVTIPVGVREANREVRVTIDPTPVSIMTHDEWRAWVEAAAGSVSDPTFRRHEQGEYEQREALS